MPRPSDPMAVSLDKEEEKASEKGGFALRQMLKQRTLIIAKPIDRTVMEKVASGLLILESDDAERDITSILAKRHAKMAGFDEALFVDSLGRLAEGSGENEGETAVDEEDREAVPEVALVTLDLVIAALRDAPKAVKAAARDALAAGTTVGATGPMITSHLSAKAAWKSSAIRRRIFCACT